MGIVKWVARLSCGHDVKDYGLEEPSIGDPVPCVRCAVNRGMPANHPDHMLSHIVAVVTNVPQRGPDGRL